MPKIVDHQKQKEKLAEAAWRIIAEEGMEHATVRRVAKEAGISLGSLRHYFPTQSELLLFSMQLVLERIRKRASSLKLEGPPVEDMKLILREILPVDEQKRYETEVWLAFTVKAMSEPSLRKFSNEIYEETKSAIFFIIQSLENLGLASPNLDVFLETERLYALIDGLALHHLQKGDEVTPKLMESVIELHLESLCRRNS
ncbi:TetR/AcrR family transcriptional regulator [Actinomycetes bacterium NPDC127524]